MKIFLFNLSVGSGIEYVGDELNKWLSGENAHIENFKLQTSEVSMISSLEEFSPDVIVMNEFFPRVMRACFYYKFFRRSTRVIVIAHSWKNVIDYFDCVSGVDVTARQILFEAEKILVMNCRPDGVLFNKNLECKSENLYMPVDPLVFRNDRIAWANRDLFCYIGTLDKLKFAVEFLDAIDGSDIQIDLYGREPKDKEFADKLLSNRSINYKGELSQNDVPKVLASYKYYILPHAGNEIFNISLLQAMFCGTIPLIWNRSDSSPWWLHWAEGLMYHSEDLGKYVGNLKSITHSIDASLVSEKIAGIARQKFDYAFLRNEVLKAVFNA